MTSFFFSRSSLSKNNNNNDDSKETLSSPSALRYAKKKNNTALIVMKARTRIFCTIISQQKIRKDKKRKNVLFTLLSILTESIALNTSVKRDIKSISSHQSDAQRDNNNSDIKLFAGRIDHRAHSKLPAPVHILLFFNNKKVF